MGHLNYIAARHRPDRWTDIIFIVGAVLLTALSIGSLTSKAVGSVPVHQWTLTVLEGQLEVAQQ
jgi:hypothetical protein